MNIFQFWAAMACPLTGWQSPLRTWLLPGFSNSAMCGTDPPYFTVRGTYFLCQVVNVGNLCHGVLNTNGTLAKRVTEKNRGVQRRWYIMIGSIYHSCLNLDLRSFIPWEFTTLRFPNSFLFTWQHLDTLMFCSAKGDIHLGFSTSPKDVPTWDCSQDDACVDVTLCSESLGFLQQPSWMYLSIALGIGSLQALSWPCHVDRVDVFFFLDWEGLACAMCHAWHCIFVALFGRCNSVMFCIVLSKRCWSYFLGAGTRYFIAFNIRPLLGLMGYVEALVVPKFLCFFLNKIHVDDLAETCSCKGTDVLFIQARRGILGRKKSAMWLVSHGGNKIYIYPFLINGVVPFGWNPQWCYLLFEIQYI